MTARLWSFTAAVPASRAERLLSYESFDSVLSIVASSTVTAFAWEPFEKEALRGCHRAAFLLEATPEAYDAFFNSPAGLRCQYAISPMQGEAATRRFLSIFEHRLLAFPRGDTSPTAQQIHWSLCAPEAKIWIREKEVESQLGDDPPAIVFPRWAEDSESGVGLLAPNGTKLEIMGGWLNPSGLVVPNPEKAIRSRDIYSRGFS